MPDPVEVENTSGVWPGFTLSGVTGTGAASINGDYYLSPVLVGGNRAYYHESSTAEIVDEGDPGGFLWLIKLASNNQFLATGHSYPWLVDTWDLEGSATGTPTFTRIMSAPVTIIPADAPATVQATLTTALTGTNNDMLFTAVPTGRLGNDVTIRYVNPAANSAALSVTVSARAITVNLATNGGGTITSTAALIKAAIEASAAATALVTVAHAAANDGSGVVIALAATALTGGLGGLPPAPVAVAA